MSKRWPGACVGGPLGVTAFWWSAGPKWPPFSMRWSYLNASLERFVRRYASILLFAAYALQESKGGFETTYSEWSHRHWQFKRVMKHLVLE